MKKLYIVMYHYTRDLVNSRYTNLKGMDLSLFKRQLEFFSENFHIVTMQQVIEACTSDVKLPEKALLLTFDDGYIDNYLFAFPLLKQYGMQGSFFVPGKTFTEDKLLDVNKLHFILANGEESSLLKDLIERMDYYRSHDFDYPSTEELYEQYAKRNRFDSEDTIFIKRMLQTVLPEQLRGIIASELFEKYVGVSENKFAKELYMNREQIRLMKNQGMFIGVHGYEHYWLANLKEKQLEKDINRSLEVMNEFIDSEGWVMNYPYGNYNTTVIDKIQKKGCVLALTTVVGSADIDKHSRYELPRLDCNDFPPKTDQWVTL